MPDQANRRLPGGTEPSAEHACSYLDNRRHGRSALIRLLIGHPPKNRTRPVRQFERSIVQWGHLFALLPKLRDTIVGRYKRQAKAAQCWTAGRTGTVGLHRRDSVELHKDAQNARPSGVVCGIRDPSTVL